MVVTNSVVCAVEELIDFVVNDVVGTAVVEIIIPVGIKVENVLLKVVVVIWGLELEDNGSKKGMIEEDGVVYSK